MKYFFNDAFYKATLTDVKKFNHIAYEKIKKNYKWMKLIEFPNFLFILFPLLLTIAYYCLRFYYCPPVFTIGRKCACAGGLSRTPMFTIVYYCLLCITIVCRIVLIMNILLIICCVVIIMHVVICLLCFDVVVNVCVC